MSTLSDVIEAVESNEVKALFSKEEYIIAVLHDGCYTLYSYPDVRKIKATDSSIKDITIICKSGERVPIQRMIGLIMQSEFKFIVQAESENLKVCAVFMRVSEKEYLLINNSDGINIHHYIKKDKIIAPYLTMKPKYADMVNVIVNTIRMENNSYSVGTVNVFKSQVSGINIVVSFISSTKFTSLSLCDKNNEVILSVNILNGNMYVIDTCKDDRIFNYFEYLRVNDKKEHNFSWISYISDLLYPKVAQVETPISYGERIGEFIANNINSGRLTRPSDISKLINSLYVEDTFDSLLEYMDKDSRTKRILPDNAID